MAVLKKIKENFGDVSKGAIAGAMMLGAVAMPFASASAADSIGQVKSMDIRAKESQTQERAGSFVSAKYKMIAVVVRGGTDKEFDKLKLVGGAVESRLGRNMLMLHTQGKGGAINGVDIFIGGYKYMEWDAKRTINDEMVNDVMASAVRQSIRAAEGTKKVAATEVKPSNP